MRRMFRGLHEMGRWGLIGALLVALATLSAIAQPTDEIQIVQNVEPSQIVVVDSGGTDAAEVRLSVIGPRPGPDSGPIDMVLALDRSASVDFEEVQEIAHTIVSHLGARDRVGIVSFADSARVDLELTEIGPGPQDSAGFNEISEAIDGLVSGRQTALGDGLMLAIDQLLDGTRPDATSLIVAPTDGVSQVGRDPLAEAERAGDNDLPIFAIGTSPAARTELLSNVADASQGRFFQRYSDDALERILREGNRAVAARYLLLTQTLPSGVSSVEGLLNGPSVLPGRYATQLQWRIPLLFEGEAWHTRYNLRFDSEGTFQINQSPSRLEYTSPQGRRMTMEFPESPIINVGCENEPCNGERPSIREISIDPSAPCEREDSGALSIQVGTSVSFSAEVSNSDSLSFRWDFGDGNSSTAVSPSHTYRETGEYTVRLRIDRQGRSDSRTRNIKVVSEESCISPPPDPGGEEPIASLTTDPSEPVVGEAVVFDASESSSPNGDITNYEWDWEDDGTFDTETSEPITRRSFGEVKGVIVRLRVTDESQQTASTTISVSIRDGVAPGASVSAASSDFDEAPSYSSWMDYYLDNGVVTDEEARDAKARFAADVYIPGTQYRMTNADLMAIEQLHELDLLMNDFASPSAAEEAGYVETGPYVDGLGQAYVNRNYLRDLRPVFNEPPVLLYGENADGEMTLAGVRFVSTMDDATLFQTADWSSRPAAAHYEDGSEEEADDPSEARPENDDGSPLMFWHPTLYGLHVWVGMPNPDGIFAPRHPGISSE